NFLKKLFSENNKKAIDHPELYAHYRAHPRFPMSSEDHLVINGKSYPVRDLSLGGTSIWVDEESGVELAKKEKLDVDGGLRFFDDTEIPLTLRLIRFDRNVVGFEFTETTKVK